MPDTSRLSLAHVPIGRYWPAHLGWIAGECLPATTPGWVGGVFWVDEDGLVVQGEEKVRGCGGLTGPARDASFDHDERCICRLLGDAYRNTEYTSVLRKFLSARTLPLVWM